MKEIDQRRTISGLHNLRALATLMVVVVHCVRVSAHPEFFGQSQWATALNFPAGEIDLFFMMSGLIMVLASYDKRTGRPRIEVFEFFRRRAIRILPLLWVAVVAYAALRIVGSPKSSIDYFNYVRALFLWPVGEVDPNVVWTIKHEAVFYVIFGFFFLYAPKIMGVATLWFCLPLMLCGATFSWRPDVDPLLGFVCSPFNIEFGIGVAMGLAHVRFGSAVWAGPPGVQLAIIFCIMLLMRVFVYSAGIGDDFGTLLFVLALAPFCFVAIGTAVKLDDPWTFRPLIFLGDASYSVFLFHPHVVSPCLMALVKVAPGMPPWLATVITTCVAVGVTCLIHILVERPIVRSANLRFHTFPFATRNARA